MIKPELGFYDCQQLTAAAASFRTAFEIRVHQRISDTYWEPKSLDLFGREMEFEIMMEFQHAHDIEV